MSEPAKALDRHSGELVLLALHDKGVARVVLQDAEIELGDQFPRGAIPDPEFGLDQTARDDVVDEAQSFEDFKRRRVGGCGAGIVVDPLLGLEDLDRKTLARQRQRRDDADRAAAGNENGALGRHFPAFYAGLGVAAIRGMTVTLPAPPRPKDAPQDRPRRSRDCGRCAWRRRGTCRRARSRTARCRAGAAPRRRSRLSPGRAVRRWSVSSIPWS